MWKKICLNLLISLYLRIDSELGFLIIWQNKKINYFQRKAEITKQIKTVKLFVKKHNINEI